MSLRRSLISSAGDGSGMDMLEGGGTGGGGAATSSSSRSNSTRRATTALSGISSTVDTKNPDFLCPICFELISEAHITKCGHTYCYQCIMRSIESSKRCPKCCANLSGQEMIFPNFLLNELVAKERLKQRIADQLMGSDMATSRDVTKLKDLIARDSTNLTLPDVDVMLEILQQRRQLLETETSIAQNRLLLDFLQQLLKQKEDQRTLIDREIGLIRRDLSEVGHILKDIEVVQRMKKRSMRRAFTDTGDGEGLRANDGDRDDEDEEEEEDEDEDEDVPGGGRSRPDGGDEQMVVDGTAADNGARSAQNDGDEEDEEEEGARSDAHIDTTTASVMHRRKIRRKHSTKQKVPELLVTSRSGGSGGVGSGGAGGLAEADGDTSTGFNTHDVKGGESSLLSSTVGGGDSFAVRKRRMYSHFEDFVNCYFHSRSQDLYFGRKSLTDGADEKGGSADVAASTAETVQAQVLTVGGGDSVETSLAQQQQQPPAAALTLTTAEPEKPVVARRMSANSRIGLDEFRESLVKFSRYSSCKTLATLGYSTDLSNGSIVSSIEFDKDNEFFAIAGVTKRIKIYDYLAVIRDVVDIHYPVAEMVSTSKISCVAWNAYHKNVLASSDYDGAVTIWDAITGQKTRLFQEHDKRCWSVDFNNVDSRLVASGSDDGRMKLWSLLSNNAVATLETKANICCVKFNPKSSCHIAFGSADHCVHYYDLRQTKKPLCVFTGHQKAVSYVKFLNESEIVSASTDSHLRLWNVNSPPYSKRSYVGHMNEKNFVGLATDGEYITCGSEDISLYVYYKGLSKPLFNLKIDRMNNGGGNTSIVNDTSSSDLNEFVSAVCWRKNCNVMVAANSRGIVKVLELV